MRGFGETVQTAALTDTHTPQNSFRTIFFAKLFFPLLEYWRQLFVLKLLWLWLITFTFHFFFFMFSFTKWKVKVKHSLQQQSWHPDSPMIIIYNFNGCSWKENRGFEERLHQFWQVLFTLWCAIISQATTCWLSLMLVINHFYFSFLLFSFSHSLLHPTTPIRVVKNDQRIWVPPLLLQMLFYFHFSGLLFTFIFQFNFSSFSHSLLDFPPNHTHWSCK